MLGSGRGNRAKCSDWMTYEVAFRQLDPFEAADGPPPLTLWPFFKWCISGIMHWFLIAGFLSALVGVIEVLTAIILGSVIDSALENGVDNLWSENTLLFAGALAFFLLLRSIIFGLSSAMTSILVVTNLNPLVHSRLHRWVLRQNIGFFDDDFAGRIAQKEMQAARAVSDVVGETINVVFSALASWVGSVLLLATINLWMAIGLGIWAVFYLLAIRWFMPRVRARGKARAGARATVTGQVVDTITNIKTVKLFARRAFEDSATIGAMGHFREEEYNFKVMATLFRFTMISLAGILPVVLVGATLYLWTKGMATPGEIVTAGAVSIRIAQMTGWVGFTVMVIYANIGEVEDAMRTLVPPNRLDETDTPVPVNGRGLVEFDAVSFGYGRENNGVQNISLTVNLGERLGVVGASGAGKSTLVALLLRL